MQELNKKKIFSKQNFPCCNTCAIYELEEILKENPEYIGFCYYHVQSRDSAAASGKLYIEYHSTNFNNSKMIPKEIIETFQKHHFETDWNNNPYSKIMVMLPEVIRLKLENDIAKEDLEDQEYKELEKVESYSNDENNNSESDFKLMENNNSDEEKIYSQQNIPDNDSDEKYQNELNLKEINEQENDKIRIII